MRVTTSKLVVTPCAVRGTVSRSRTALENLSLTYLRRGCPKVAKPAGQSGIFRSRLLHLTRKWDTRAY